MQFPPAQPHPASYRDPSGFVFEQEGALYRQVNKVFKEDFDLFINSGLYHHLSSKGWLITHQVIDKNLTGSLEWHCTLQPERIPFITYPYEWSFAMLKEAALLTLQLAEESMKFGMMLKDASPYNVQWREGKVIFIDTLSFEKADTTKPWIAYRQFCENFIAPLALMHYAQVPLQSLLLAYPEGIPLTYAAKLLPWKSRLSLHLYLHLHLHSRYASAKNGAPKEPAPFSAQKLKNLYRSLRQLVQSFQLEYKGIWANYYNEAERRPDYLPAKKEIIENWLNALPNLRTAIDVGGNDGHFARLLAARGIDTICADSDHFAVDKLYKQLHTEKETNILPLVIEFTNPTPATGVNNEERSNLFDRIYTDLVLHLAIIHHLAIGKNIPFGAIATLLRKLGDTLIIEFVPKEDEKIQVMLQGKRDSHTWYNEENFKAAFQKHYKVIASQKVGTSGRTLYLMKPHEQ